MIQTDRKTDSRKAAPEQKRLPEQNRRRQGPEIPVPEQTLQAILAGVSPDRLSPEAVLTLSHTMGNSALAEMVSRQSRSGLDFVSAPVPGPLPDMAPAVLGEGTADLMAPVDFAGLPPLEAGPGLTMGGQ